MCVVACVSVPVYVCIAIKNNCPIAGYRLLAAWLSGPLSVSHSYANMHIKLFMKLSC